MTPDDRLAARRVLDDCAAWDNHACMPLRPHDLSFMPQLQRHKAAGFDAVTLNVGFGEQVPQEHLRMLAALRHWVLARPGEYLLLQRAGDVERARATNRLAVGFDIEGANALGGQTSLVQMYYDLGVRWMALAYNRNNDAGGGCQDDDDGLTAFGREVVAEMERVGMLVCLSHTGHRTAREVLALATRPVIFSHSNCAALHAHPRNIPDDLIRACAATGGVVGINGVGIFLGRNDTSSEAYARHVDHVVQQVGPAHVAVALDYVFDLGELDEYMAKMQHTFPPGLGYELGARFVAPEQIEEIVATLLGWGYKSADPRRCSAATCCARRAAWKEPALAETLPAPGARVHRPRWPRWPNTTGSSCATSSRSPPFWPASPTTTRRCSARRRATSSAVPARRRDAARAEGDSRRGPGDARTRHARAAAARTGRSAPGARDAVAPAAVAAARRARVQHLLLLQRLPRGRRGFGRALCRSHRVRHLLRRRAGGPARRRRARPCARRRRCSCRRWPTCAAPRRPRPRRRRGSPFKRTTAAPQPEVQAQAARALSLIEKSIAPALAALADCMEHELLPRARDSVACTDEPLGEEYYGFWLRHFPTLPEATPASVHALGLAQVQRIGAEIAAVAAEAGFANDVPGYRRFLRDEKSFYAPTAEALRQQVEALAKRIDGQIPTLVGRLPRITYGVQSIPEAAAQHMPLAYAQPNPADGASAGWLWVSGLPQRVPSYVHLPLVLHEAWPGHLMHIALMQEMDTLPMFRRANFTKYTACLEGWAMYCETLGIDLGLYTTPHQHYGRLDMEMWRACRLVVDTGIHAQGWSRERAVAYMAEHLTMSRGAIEAEVDRYIAMPGQALAYLVGGLKFRELRQRARERLGDRFNLRAYHDQVLAAGPVTLPVLEETVDDWLARDAT
ncbi:MAG: DUF885 family protein [Rubrivivax sp.]